MTTTLPTCCPTCCPTCRTTFQKAQESLDRGQPRLPQNLKPPTSFEEEMALPSVARGKARKAKRVSKIARGRFARALVLRGSKEKTVGGLRADALMKNKRGKVVSKRASAAGTRRFRHIEGWVQAITEARSALKMTGFVAVNGKTIQGKALYVKTKALRGAKRSEQAAE